MNLKIQKKSIEAEMGIGIPFESRLPAFPYGQRRMDQYRKPYVPGDSTERESNAGSKTAE